MQIIKSSLQQHHLFTTALLNIKADIQASAVTKSTDLKDVRRVEINLGDSVYMVSNISLISWLFHVIFLEASWLMMNLFSKWWQTISPFLLYLWYVVKYGICSFFLLIHLILIYNENAHVGFLHTHGETCLHMTGVRLVRVSFEKLTQSDSLKKTQPGTSMIKLSN